MKPIQPIIFAILILLGGTGAWAQSQCRDLFTPESALKMSPVNAVNRYFEIWEALLKRSENGKKMHFSTGDILEYRSALEDMQQALKAKLAGISKTQFPNEALAIEELIKRAEGLSKKSIPYDEFVVFWDPYVRAMNSQFGREKVEGALDGRGLLMNLQNGVIDRDLLSNLLYPKPSFFIPDTRGSGYSPFIWLRFTGFRLMSVYSEPAYIHHNMTEPLLALQHDLYHERQTSKLSVVFDHSDFNKVVREEYARYASLATKYEKISDPYLKRAISYLLFQVLNETGTRPSLESVKTVVWRMNLNAHVKRILDTEADIPSQYFVKLGGDPAKFLGDPAKGELAPQTLQKLSEARDWIVENI